MHPHINKSFRMTLYAVVAAAAMSLLSIAVHSGPTLLGPHFITAGPSNLACAVNLSQVCKTFSLHSVPPPAVTVTHHSIQLCVLLILPAALLSLSSAVSLVYWRACALIENAL